DRRATAATRGEPRCCRDHRRSGARDFGELCHPEAFGHVFSLTESVKEVNILQHVTALAALLGLSYATAADNSVAQNPHGAAAVFESLGSAILMPVQQCEVVESTRDNHVLGAERFLLYGQGALIQRLGLGVAPLADVERREIAKAGGERRVFGADRLLLDRETALIEWFGLGIAPLLIVQQGEVVYVFGDV